MCDHETETVLPSFGEDRFDRVGHIVLEFIDVEEEILAFTRCHLLTLHGTHLDLGDEDETEEGRIEIPECTL